MAFQAHPNSSQDRQAFAPKILGQPGISRDAIWDDFASLGREDVMPGRPFQSKLEPHLDFIREGRRKRWSYRRIAQAIGEQFGMKVSPNAIFSFVKVRSKPLRMYELHSPSTPSTTHPADGFFESPSAQPKPKNESSKPKYNLGF